MSHVGDRFGSAIKNHPTKAGVEVANLSSDVIGLLKK